ncbi:UDP-N-acetylmuramate:L-alanyl-gamma-D-glutamyl-meso-diaminopimelate ligase [Prosthecochloris sp. ZM]|uniref:UDP-N-acetylmuramate:L-alanyl-gamma-D-glutamyl- meso-diaminopimelate ligase n=1 Tax=unclassified Prosthecochloris TaxID=2632826 RepID=UPI000DF7D120|nr:MULTISPECIES: UDP-N-acetylmuramate:L-alanyl-gamma-D-glutamyl-meso-diaminopimelate ligase [unclassified Prosthecochloris]NEX12072.1 UDP-N-acetylmuramate:L-alanyl-gamma-D-glutamyl-meso-diaminopimelate ligase [Prosthecochloris sp.]RDD29858.1 UDP-N-acetylmuramate:L-alanyl-gamma-D-glutamyl-meso-diaminopimelate ligase [Prosthecochloris sp. ZM]
MTNMKPGSSIYFIGIGGTAMASVAVALCQAGYMVSGSDTSLYPPMSDYLYDHAITCHEGFDAEHLAETEPDAIVVGNAVSRGNPELEYALNRHLPMTSMPEIVRTLLIDANTSVVVTGTHGKTTTTSLIAWLFEYASYQPGFLIGGIAENFGAGCRASAGKKNNGWFITEGDEYDSAFFDKRSKFMHYRPDIAIINNIEFDHADIFNSIEDIKRSFRHFVNLVPSEGLLLCNGHDAVALDIASKAFCRVERFGLDKSCDWSARNIEANGERTAFELLHNQIHVGNLEIPLFGTHNILNTLAAIGSANQADIQLPVIAEALRHFKGPKRRMEVIGDFPGNITLIDDFAHHPTAIKATLDALRQRFPSRRIIACFEPRSNTSTRNTFQEEFSSCFDSADIVVLGKVHRPERYPENERLDTRQIVEKIAGKGKAAFAAGLNIEQYPLDIVRFLERTINQNDVIILLSNGSFDNLKTLLAESFNK